MNRLMRVPAFVIGLMLACSGAPGGADAAESLKNVDRDGIAINGYDPVSYHRGSPEKGRTGIRLDHDGATYLFASREHLDAFRSDPQRYAPAYGGWCAWAMLDGEKVPINPKRYKLIDGRTYLFYDTFFVNTLAKWNTLADEKTERALVEQANGQWEQLITP